MLKHVPLVNFAILIGLLAGAQVWQAYLRVDTAQEFTKLEEEKVKLQQDVQSFKLELASITRPDTLRRLARQVGMSAPTSMQVVKP
ncbi:MAG: cell division protein FtsL [Ghiorsea sp.]